MTTIDIRGTTENTVTGIRFSDRGVLEKVVGKTNVVRIYDEVLDGSTLVCKEDVGNLMAAFQKAEELWFSKG